MDTNLLGYFTEEFTSLEDFDHKVNELSYKQGSPILHASKWFKELINSVCEAQQSDIDSWNENILSFPELAHCKNLKKSSFEEQTYKTFLPRTMSLIFSLVTLKIYTFRIQTDWRRVSTEL